MAGSGQRTCQRTWPAVVTSRAYAYPGGREHVGIGGPLLQPASPATAQAHARAAKQARRVGMNLGRIQVAAGPHPASHKTVTPLLAGSSASAVTGTVSTGESRPRLPVCPEGVQ